MARKRYREEYKHHFLELVREGRTLEQLAKEYEPSARTFRNWGRAPGQVATAAEIDKDQEVKKLTGEVVRL